MTYPAERPSFLDAKDPFALFADWFDQAETAEHSYANAVSLATLGLGGEPNVRIVLIKDFGPAGFVWYTNLLSRKGKELAATPMATICYHWKSLNRQVRISGPVEHVGDAEADAYFASRARESQIGAWASLQSEVLPDRADFETRYQEVVEQYDGGDVPRPRHWSGYRLRPNRIEFWQDRNFRLHDRLVFEADGSAWTTHCLYP